MQLLFVRYLLSFFLLSTFTLVFLQNCPYFLPPFDAFISHQLTISSLSYFVAPILSRLLASYRELLFPFQRIKTWAKHTHLYTIWFGIPTNAEKRKSYEFMVVKTIATIFRTHSHNNLSVDLKLNQHNNKNKPSFLFLPLFFRSSGILCCRLVLCSSLRMKLRRKCET